MTNKLNILEEKEPWFSSGLRFGCTECGQCCTGAPGFVWVTQEEIAAIANHFKISIHECKKKYIRQINEHYSLIENPKTFDCIFLKDKKCQIYLDRPKQCRTFPWWVHNVRSEKDWNEAAKYCEGINHPDAQLIPCKTILEQLSNPTPE